MKSYVEYLKGLYAAMLSNIAEHDPSLHRDCERDASRLLSLIEQRGLPFLMVDLPAAAKHFDKALAAGRLTSFGIAGFRPFRRGGVIPRLFKGLLLRVFDESGSLRVDADVACISAFRQLSMAAKKVKVACPDSRTWEHVHEFFTVDQEVRSPSLDWEADTLRLDDLRNLHLGDSCSLQPAPLLDLLDRVEESVTRCHPDTLDAAQRVADIVSGCLGGFNPSCWRPKHGPGAVADQRHTQFKYDFPHWPAKLNDVFPLDEFAFANYALWADFVTDNGCGRFSSHEPPSRLIAVPKTLKGPRLIAAEPVSHQWCQQIVMDFLVSRLPYTPISSSIRFRDQSKNGRLALEASHTQSHVTVDLSSASDRLSCWVVERVFRRIPSLVEALHASRTRWVSNDIDRKSPSFHKIRKFACMGSACTFPVQTYVFTILAVASVLSARKVQPTIRSVRRISKEVQVFGDDIIVPIDSWDHLQGMLDHLGFKVNADKTFGTGKFRESCGVDAFDGNDVTPTYVNTFPDKSRPGSIASNVDAHNNFFDRGWYGVSRYLRETIRRVGRYPVPDRPVDSGVFGFNSFSGFSPSSHKVRWNEKYHRMEAQVAALRSKAARVVPERDSVLLQYFTEVRPVRFIEGDRLGVAQRATVSIVRRWVPLSDFSFS